MLNAAPPSHPSLLDPATGRPLQALGTFRGRPLWPALGAEDDSGGDEGGAGDESKEPAYPKGTPVAEMTAEQQAAYWQAQSRKHEGRAKKYADYDEVKKRADQYDALEQASKTEDEKRTEALVAAEKRATEADLRATRLDVAFAKGLTPAQAKRLVGSTREELEADADEVLRDFPVAPKQGGRGPDMGQGNRGGSSKLTGRDQGLAEAEKRFGKKANTTS